MMGPLQNAMRLQAQRAGASNVSSSVGEVTNYDPNTFTARVQLQPTGIITGWLPVASPWIGNGWGLFAAPNIGDMVTVEYINGDIQAGVIIARMWNLTDLPLPVPSGEFWLVHKLGGFFKMTNDGKVSFNDGQGASFVLDGDGSIASAATAWNHTGNVNVSGTLTASTDVVGGGKSLAHHLTTGVQPGSGISGPPQ